MAAAGAQTPSVAKEPHGSDELGGFGVLEQQAAGSGTERGEESMVCLSGREHHHGDPGLGEDPPRRLDAVEARHVHVDQHHVGTGAAGESDRLLTGGGLADHDDPRLALEQEANAGAYQPLTVGDSDTDRAGGMGGAGALDE
jgi:hypothetical protein